MNHSDITDRKPSCWLMLHLMPLNAAVIHSYATSVTVKHSDLWNHTLPRMNRVKQDADIMSGLKLISDFFHTSYSSSLLRPIQDTAGSERYEAMSRIYYRGARAAIVCYGKSKWMWYMSSWMHLLIFSTRGLQLEAELWCADPLLYLMWLSVCWLYMFWLVLEAMLLLVFVFLSNNHWRKWYVWQSCYQSYLSCVAELCANTKTILLWNSTSRSDAFLIFITILS